MLRAKAARSRDRSGQRPVRSRSIGRGVPRRPGVVVAVGLVLHALLAGLGAERLDRWTRAVEGALFCPPRRDALLLVLQVILRNFFHHGVLWFDPLVRTLVLWVAFLGALMATSQRAAPPHRRRASDPVPEDEPAVGRALSIIAAVCCALMANGASIYLREEYLHGGVRSWGSPPGSRSRSSSGASAFSPTAFSSRRSGHGAQGPRRGPERHEEVRR